MREVHPSWLDTVEKAYAMLDVEYRVWLQEARTIPEQPRIFNAFKTLPREDVRYILFGQDPYPRAVSATGYAFIDGAVDRIFSNTGLSKPVNRATSLRNFVKMALVCEGLLDPCDLSQSAIAAIDKRGLIRTIDDLRKNFERNGVLLLNASLVYEEKASSRRHAAAWRPFIRSLLASMDENRVRLILFGGIAKEIRKLPEASRFSQIATEHPYNVTFIHNPEVHALFAPMRLMRANEACVGA